MFIQHRVELHHVERAEPATVGDHAHAQLRLRQVGAVGHRGGDAGCDVGVEEVDVEAHMQMCLSVHAGQGARHHFAHAECVQGLHIEDRQAELLDQINFTGIHAAHADLSHGIGRQGRHLAAQLRECRRPDAAQAGQRHAVQVGAGAGAPAVGVGMGVEPEHAQAFADGAAVTRCCADGADRQAVVAAQQQRQPALRQCAGHGIVHHLVPGDHFIKMAVAVLRLLLRVGRAAKVTRVMHLQAKRLQGGRQAGRAQRLRPLAGARSAGAHICRGTDEGDVVLQYGYHCGKLWRERQHVSRPTGGRRPVGGQVAGLPGPQAPGAGHSARRGTDGQAHR